MRSIQHALNALLAPSQSAPGLGAQQETGTDEGLSARIGALQNEIRVLRRQQDDINENIPPPMYKEEEQCNPLPRTLPRVPLGQNGEVDMLNSNLMDMARKSRRTG